MNTKLKVSIVMGSISDKKVMEKSAIFFGEVGIPFEMRVLSAHRTPDEIIEYAKELPFRGIQYVVAAAGMAAHLAGILQANAPFVTVYGVPIGGTAFNGLEALLSTVQMPPGVPVATVGVDGSLNAAILVARELAKTDTGVYFYLDRYFKKQREKVLEADKVMERTYYKGKMNYPKNSILNTLQETNFLIGDSKYVGKVRDVYHTKDLLTMIATDRISAFDVVLPECIPHKGQVLNQISEFFLDAVTDVCPIWKIATPHSMVMVGYKCETFPVEMIVRDYNCGSLWKDYKIGKRTKSGVSIPDGMKENEKFPSPIVTPTTKAEQGEHDQDISREEIIHRGLVSKEDYELLEQYSLALFKRGQEVATQRGLILVDTKYEFGWRMENQKKVIYLIDEIHTPDSSRYWYAETYGELFAEGKPQRQLSKEFVREWLMENGFEGKSGQVIPEITPDKALEISNRYVELYEKLTGKKFVKADSSSSKEIENSVNYFLEQYPRNR
jgi:phosphoribosylaminoimidazole-succinocarboxamide synthase